MFTRALTALVLAFLVQPTAAAGVPHYQRVVLVVLENAAADAAAAQPYLKQLAAEGASLRAHSAITHPSQPNYVALVAGDLLGVTDNDRHVIDARHLGDLVEAKGLDWHVYAEGFPGDCSQVATRGEYARRHVPFLSFGNVADDPQRCAKITDAAGFSADALAGRLPAFSLYVPDNSSNGHDTGVEAASRWLERTFEPLLASPTFRQGTLFIVTFDEGTAADNRVFTVLLGEHVKAGAVSDRPYTHYSLLRTIEAALGLDTLGRNDATSAPIDDVFD